VISAHPQSRAAVTSAIDNIRKVDRMKYFSLHLQIFLPSSSIVRP
jgi:hypothetical protein